MPEMNKIGGSPESPPLDFAPQSPLAGWSVIHGCILSDRITLDHPVWEVLDGRSTSPIRSHRLVIN
jgi:hypothetical protein